MPLSSPSIRCAISATFGPGARPVNSCERKKGCDNPLRMLNSFNTRLLLAENARRTSAKSLSMPLEGYGKAMGFLCHMSVLNNVLESARANGQTMSHRERSLGRNRLPWIRTVTTATGSPAVLSRKTPRPSSGGNAPSLLALLSNTASKAVRLPAPAA